MGRQKHTRVLVEENSADAKSEALKRDVGGLLEQCSVEEAVARVWGRFEDALTILDEESLSLFTSYLKGTSVQRLSQERKLPEKDVSDWILRIKRQVISELRKDCNVRQ